MTMVPTTSSASSAPHVPVSTTRSGAKAAMAAAVAAAARALPGPDCRATKSTPATDPRAQRQPATWPASRRDSRERQLVNSTGTGQIRRMRTGTSPATVAKKWGSGNT